MFRISVLVTSPSGISFSIMVPVNKHNVVTLLHYGLPLLARILSVVRIELRSGSVDGSM
jgi:hypothetical protein